ncbi:MAG: glycosyltransferase family 1 protein [Nitriliruptorales bacterium]|nr:glycosyltransferase family 1 protein [Nitriliruptorales bacterium]
MTDRQLVVDARQWNDTGIGTHLRLAMQGLVDAAVDRVVAVVRRGDVGEPGLPANLVVSRVDSAYLPPVDARRRLSRRSIATWWIPHYAIYRAPAGRLVSTVHDLIHLEDPSGLLPPWKRTYARGQLRRVARLADAVITPSNATAARLVARHPALDGRVHVIPNGIDPGWALARPHPRAAREQRVVYVGTSNPHKDLPTALEAAGLLAERDLTPEWMFVTASPWRDPRLPDAIDRARRRGAHVTFTDAPVPTAVLVDLVSRSLLSVHPSLQEGFGLTLAEAMSVGTPPVASRIDAHCEVAADGATWFAPGSATELAQHVEHLLRDANAWRLAGVAAQERGAILDAGAMQRSMVSLLLDPAEPGARADSP